MNSFRNDRSLRVSLLFHRRSGSWPSVYAAETTYPLTLENCGRQITFDKTPTRTVSIGQSSTEILYLLGLADKVAGTALWVGPVLEGYEEVNAKVERLADNDPSFESVLAKKPDMVAVQFQWQVGPEGVVARPEQFEELGIPVYIAFGLHRQGELGGERRRATAGLHHGPRLPGNSRAGAYLQCSG